MSFIKIFLISAYQIILKQLLLQFFCLFFLVFRNTPTPPSWWMPSKIHSLFLYLCFLCLAFLISFVPLKKSVIIALVIVIMPSFYLLLRHEPIRDIFQRRRVISYGLMTHLLSFKMIRDMVQLPWVYLKPLNLHFLSFKTGRNKKSGSELMRVT